MVGTSSILECASQFDLHKFNLTDHDKISTSYYSSHSSISMFDKLSQIAEPRTSQI